MDIRVGRIINRLEQLGSISDNSDCLSRFFGTNAHSKAKDLLVLWMQQAGLKVLCDNIGNVRGIYKSNVENAKHFVIGSHYDTVFNAGKFDGPLGIIMGIEIAQRLIKENKDLPFHLNIISFSDEEGSRFNTAYLGSSALAGEFKQDWLLRKDDSGKTLSDTIRNYSENFEAIFNDKIPKQDWLGYYEIHIEQGPVLCEKDLPICLVSSIASQTRINVNWQGVSGHAGTSPMNLRYDALCAASEFILEVEKTGTAYQDKLVATVGKMNVLSNTSNVIPELVCHSLDVRSADEGFLNQITDLLQKKAKQISEKRNIGLKWEIMQTNPAVLCDNQLKDLLRKSINKIGITNPIEIPSGAGHDAVMISKVAPISMLFVRCKDGISHNPEEYASPEDIEVSLKVSDQFLEELIKVN
ncbi:allantoate deiminase [Flaviramulus basaltis]|uniref:Allantoate deiminase n=1 Tax=Flaviramulus basaltis TaxID=369401 RepID=A0A1K2IAC4_9FLAO|nr:M20 family metallo-hydrolase [Flaviramulus basaltis]SFZ89351.1 allantoate deiminase [Flaviramulus basaltis]